jgi:nucleoside-diphosphate-sugar epimerase
MASSGTLFGLPTADLDHILRHAAADLNELRGRRLFITGGTGFFGKWLLAALVHAGNEMRLDLKLEVLSRQPAAFLKRHPEVAAQKNILFHQGEVANLAAADFSPCDYTLHAATDSVGIATPEQENERTRAILDGTARVLDLARRGSATRTLLVSSGGVYGTTCPRHGAAEDDAAQAQNPTAYGRAKREAENLALASGLDIVIARPFAFLGPLLPLDAHYAAGNFLRDAMRGGPIVVRGDGTAVRSYLHPADLVIWILRIMVRGQKARAYNIGSDEAVTTGQLARLIADACPTRPQVVLKGNAVPGAASVYLPTIRRAREELSLDVFIPLRESIDRTLNFLSPSS